MGADSVATQSLRDDTVMIWKLTQLSYHLYLFFKNEVVVELVVTFLHIM